LPETSTTSAVEEVLKEFCKGLHDLSQPLTALQCRLFLATMSEAPSETVNKSLEDCERLMEKVHHLQNRLQSLKSRNPELPLGDKS
jgi:phosphoglycerate-specific signal transduction histidine kinase